MAAVSFKQVFYLHDDGTRILCAECIKTKAGPCRQITTVKAEAHRLVCWRCRNRIIARGLTAEDTEAFSLIQSQLGLENHFNLEIETRSSIASSNPGTAAGSNEASRRVTAVVDQLLRDLQNNLTTSELPRLTTEDVDQVTNNEVGVAVEGMSQEGTRMETFALWTNPYLSSREMARAGFFYTGQGDRVKCFSCGIELAGWIRSSDIREAHRYGSPGCRFLQQLDHLLTPQRADLPPVRRRQVGRRTRIFSPRGRSLPTLEEETQTEARPRVPDQGPSVGFEDCGTKCKVCLVNDIDCILVPCNHVTCCLECGVKLKDCPICRANIQYWGKAWIA